MLEGLTAAGLAVFTFDENSENPIPLNKEAQIMGKQMELFTEGDLTVEHKIGDISHTVSGPAATVKAYLEQVENGANTTDAPAGLFTKLLELTGDDPTREGLHDTPKRMLKAFQHWFKGYYMDPKDILKVFEDGAENVDQMVLVKDIPIYSKCEHHMADIFGTASIAYIPNGKIVGLSKLSRLADCFARRLQVQERLTNQIADALVEHLQPLGVGVVIKARHMCMESRGICQQGHHTVTSALRGVIRDDRDARSEFFSLVNAPR